MNISNTNSETTLAIIKPGAVKNGHTGHIIQLIELNGFVIQGLRKLTMTKPDAERFYAVHKERPFFGELVDHMISGPIVVMKLAKNNAVQEWRTLMGATNPAQATPGTIRRMFGVDIGSNAVHGSDSLQTAATELPFFF